MTNLVLIPGLMCDRTVWQPQIEDLSAIARCQVADHGCLNSLGAMAEKILREAPPEFALAGHSMGGRVALEVFRRAPERVQRLAVMCTKYTPLPAGQPGEQEKAGRYALLEIARSQGVRAMAQQWVQGMVRPERRSDAALISAIVDMFGRKTADIFAAQIEALLGRPGAGPLLGSVQCPTLILCGRFDTWSPPVAHEEMAAQIESSTLTVVEDAGHMAPLESPAVVSRAMRDWLERG